MKKSNIAFSGFMAAILVSVGAANAAPARIASQEYVDKKQTETLATVSNTYETKANVTNLTEQVTQLGDTINNEDTGLAAKVDDAVAAATEAKQTADTAKSTATGAQSAVEALGATVGNAESGLVKDVNDLETSVGGLQTTVSGLDKELDSKLDSATAATTYEKVSNKSQDLATDAGSTDKYPSAKAVVDWVSNTVTEGIEINTDKIQNGAITTEKIGDDAVTADKIAPDAVGNEQIADGAVTSDKLDGTLAGQIADISGKQDKKMGDGHENHIVTTDETGTITSVATIEQSQVTGLTDALAGKASTADIPTAVSELTNDSGYLTNDDMTGYAKTTDLEAKQNKNVGIENNGKILTVGADGNITTSATIAQSKVEGLETALAGKLESDDLTGYVTSESLTTTLDGYATTTDLGAKQDKLTATGAANQPVYVNEQGVVTAGNTIPTVTTNITTGITDAAQAGAVADKLAQKEDAANKVKTINDGNKSSETLFPTIGAITTWTDQQIQKLSDTGIPVNPDNIGNSAITTEKIANGAVTTEKIADDAVTEDKLSNEVVAKIDGKADANDVYTKTETDAKILEVALRRPINTCTGTDLCVLSITPENGLAWVNVTDPVGELPTPTVDLDEGIQQ